MVFHTARDNKVVARAEMPSPSAKLKAARRLPKRLRISGEAPDGDIARIMRDEAAERYERGESSSSTLHSCLQKTHKGWKGKHPDWGSNSHWSWHGQWTASWSGGYDWEEGAERQHLWRSEASPSSAQPSSGPPVDEPDSHTDRPLPPTPPTPRRLKKELAKLTEEGASHESAKGETARVMAAVKSKPRSTRNRSKGASPGANAAATGAAGEAGSHAGEAGDAVASRPQSRSLVQETVERPNQPDMQPPATAIALEGEGSATSRCSTPDRPETTAENARRERRRVRSSTLSNDSDDVAVVLSDWAPGSQPEMLTGSHPPKSAASGSLAKASASTGPSREDRPEASKWTPEDTKLSKAMSRLLRHKSNLKLDEAGYAKLSDMLEHPRLRDMKPTKERMMHVVQHNFKQRFALNEAGTHIRAKQGHSIKVDPSKTGQRGHRGHDSLGSHKADRQDEVGALSETGFRAVADSQMDMLTVTGAACAPWHKTTLHDGQQCRADSRLHSSSLYC